MVVLIEGFYCMYSERSSFGLPTATYSNAFMDIKYCMHLMLSCLLFSMLSFQSMTKIQYYLFLLGELWTLKEVNS